MVCRARVLDGLSRSLWGSVLGLILFMLYITDLPDSLQSQVRLFADGSAVYLTVKGQADSKKLQNDLNIGQEWERGR